MDNDMEFYWYNYTTKEYDLLGTPENDEQAKKYISQQPAVQGLYSAYRKMGYSILDSMGFALSACVGETWEPVDPASK